MTKTIDEIKEEEEEEEEVSLILSGIDKDDLESEDGWWETSTGAEFGSNKLKEVIDYIVKEIHNV